MRPTYLVFLIDPFLTERQAVSLGELSIFKDGAFEMLDLDNDPVAPLSTKTVPSERHSGESGMARAVP